MGAELREGTSHVVVRADAEASSSRQSPKYSHWSLGTRVAYSRWLWMNARMNGQNGRTTRPRLRTSLSVSAIRCSPRLRCLCVLLDLGVGEREHSGTGQVFAVAGKVAVDMDLIPVSLWTVADDNAH